MAHPAEMSLHNCQRERLHQTTQLISTGFTMEKANIENVANHFNNNHLKLSATLMIKTEK